MCIDLIEHLYKTPNDHFLKLYNNSNRSFVTYSHSSHQKQIIGEYVQNEKYT